MDLPTTTIKKIKADANTFVTKHLDIRVTTDETFTEAGEALIHTKQRLKRIETLRKEIVAPLNAHVKKINSMFKQESAPFSILENTLKSEMSNYNTKKEEELKQHTEVQEAPISKTKTESGSTSVRKQWVFEVEDESKIPQEYFILDESKVRTAIKDGQRDIPGMKIFPKSVISVRA